MRISDWSSDVCSSDLAWSTSAWRVTSWTGNPRSASSACSTRATAGCCRAWSATCAGCRRCRIRTDRSAALDAAARERGRVQQLLQACGGQPAVLQRDFEHRPAFPVRSEEPTSELQSLMRISYAVFCLKKKKTTL